MKCLTVPAILKIVTDGDKLYRNMYLPLKIMNLRVTRPRKWYKIKRDIKFIEISENFLQVRKKIEILNAYNIDFYHSQIILRNPEYYLIKSIKRYYFWHVVAQKAIFTVEGENINTCYLHFPPLPYFIVMVRRYIALYYVDSM